MSDDALRIDIQTIGGEKAVNILTTLADKTQEVTDLLNNTGWGNKEIGTLTKEFNQLANSMSVYAKAVADVNKTNQSASMGQQKLATEMNRTQLQAAKLAMQNMRNANMTAKMAAAAQKAQAPYNQLRSDLAAAELALKNLYTTGARGANLNNAISEYQRLSTAVENVNNQMRMSASGAYTRMNAELQQYGDKLRNAIAAGNLNEVTLSRMGDKYKRLQGEVNAVDAKFNQLTGTVEKNSNSLSMFDVAMGNFIANTLQRGIAEIGQFVSELSKAGVAMDGIRNTFAAGARGLEQGAEEMAFTAEMANKLGLNLQSTYEPYAKFMTSFTRSGGTIAQSRQIFEDLSTAMVSLHLSSAQMNNVFIALEQMANKGTVQAEELKRQLGNALPGAFELAAQSMNVTAGELMDLMKKGEVMSKDFLPNFAAMVKDSLGKQIGIAVDQYNAHLNRMQTQTFMLQANMGSLLNEAVVPVIKAWTGILQVANGLTKGLSDNVVAITALQAAFVAFGGVLVGTTVKLIATKAAAAALVATEAQLTVGMKLAMTATAAWRAVVTALTSQINIATAATVAWNAVLNATKAHPLIAALTVLTAVILGCVNAMNKANKEFAEQAVQQRDVTNNVTGLIAEFSELAEIQDRSSAQQEAYNRNLEMLRSQYPEVLKYIQDHGISIRNVTEEQAKNIARMATQSEMMKAQRTLQEELGNGWIIFGTRAKQAGQAIIVALQAIEVAIAHVATAIVQIFTRAFSLIVKGVGKITEGIGNMATSVGFEWGKTWQDAAKGMQGLADKSWAVGSEFHSNLNGALKECAKSIQAIEFERQEKAMTRYKDTVAILGQEEAKLAKQLLYTSSAVSGLSLGGTDKDKKKKGKSKSAKEPDSEWDLLNKEIQKTEELMKVRLLNGQSIEDLEPKYARLKKQQDDVNRAMKELTETPATGWDRIKKNLEQATKSYQYMLAHSKSYTAQEIEAAKNEMKKYNAVVKYNEQLKKSEEMLTITSREAGKLANTLIDSLFDPLSEGETMWDRFRDAGLSALKAISTEWIKTLGNKALLGAQAGWQQNGSGNRLFSAILGFGSGIAGTPLEGTKDKPTYTGQGALNGALYNKVGSVWGSIKSKLGIGQQAGQMTGAAAGIQDINLLTNLTDQANNLGSALSTVTSPAVDGVTAAISGVANPAVQAAGSIGSMAMNAPMAAMGMASMSASLTALSPAATSCAPALMQMGAALATIAANAGSAATSMAALAVATAAESVAKIPYVGGFLAPVAAAATGAAIAAGTIMTGAGIAAGSAIAGAGQMLGGGMAGIGNKLSGASKSASIIPHAKGGIVSSPTMFPMQGGNIGLAGEAGEEVIAPARRMANGDVGIAAVPPQVTINNYTNAAVEVKRRPDNSTEIKIAELNAMLSSSRTNKGMASAQSRMQKSGKQVG